MGDASDMLDYLRSMIPGLGDQSQPTRVPVPGQMGKTPTPPPSQWPQDQPITMAHPPVHQMTPTPNVNVDEVAKQRGFKDGASMQAFYQRQQEQQPQGQTQGGRSLLDQALSIHPAYLLKHILDRWNQADGTTPSGQ